MRVALLVERFPSIGNPLLAERATALLARGCDVEILALRTGAPRPVQGNLREVELRERTRSAALPRGWLACGIGALPRALDAAVASPRALVAALDAVDADGALALRSLYAIGLLRESDRFDLVHAECARLGAVAARLRHAGLFDAALVSDIRSGDVGGGLRRPPGYETLFGQGALFLASSDHVRTRCETLGCDPRRLRVQRPGIDAARLPFAVRRPPARGPLQLVSAAPLVETAGLGYAIAAVDALHRGGTEVEYTILGDGPAHRDLARVAERLGVATCVRLAGARPWRELVETLALSHLFVVPSATDRAGNDDNLPRGLLAAMAMGLPVVATRHAGLPELVEDGATGYLVSERDVHALAERIGFLARHPEPWAALASAARAAVVERHDLERQTDALRKLYAQVTSV